AAHWPSPALLAESSCSTPPPRGHRATPPTCRRPSAPAQLRVAERAPNVSSHVLPGRIQPLPHTAPSHLPADLGAAPPLLRSRSHHHSCATIYAHLPPLKTPRTQIVLRT